MGLKDFIARQAEWLGIKDFIAGQARRPSGWFGRLIAGAIFNRVNADLVDQCIELLEIEKEHEVLDVGFGGGYALERIARELTTGTAIGVDLSEAMVTRARKKFRSLIGEGNLEVRRADAVDLPFEDNSIDRAMGTNVIYFWPDPVAVAAEIGRVLTPDGRLVLGFYSRETMAEQDMPDEVFTLYEGDEVVDILDEAGYSSVRAVRRDGDEPDSNILVIGDCENGQ